MKKNHLVCFLALLLLVIPLTAQADMVLDWNNYALNTIRASSASPPFASRSLAITHGAIFDAVNSIHRNYTPYQVQLNGTGASAKAAVAAAGYTALVGLYPGQAASLLNYYNSSLDGIPNGAAKNQGIALGQTIATSFLTLRSTDGWNASSSYAPTDPPLPGHWQKTPPAFANPLSPQWGNVTPFAMTSGSQFRQEPPPALDSQRYADEFNEVKSLGAINSGTRTPDQTEIAYFWLDGASTQTPPGHWNAIAQTVAAAQGNNLVQNARLFALLNLANADAAISAWDMKYLYDFWRPITAIRSTLDDGNPLTESDPTWTPLATTPPFPSYVSGHSTFSAASAAILAELFGDAVSFTSESDGLVINGNPVTLTRSYTSFSQAALEAGRSRIYGGIHYECDNEFGLKAGGELGHYVFANYLVPTPLPGTLALCLSGLGMLLAGRGWRIARK